VAGSAAIIIITATVVAAKPDASAAGFSLQHSFTDHSQYLNFNCLPQLTTMFKFVVKLIVAVVKY